MKMIHFEGIEQCACKKSFEWAITKPEKNEFIFGEEDKLIKMFMVLQKFLTDIV